MSSLSSFGQKISLTPSAHIQLSFSQEVYAPGDTAYFAARYHNDDLTAIKGANFLSVAAYNASSEVVYSTHIKVIDGIGTGYVFFPEESTSGIFTVIAYSNITGSRICKKSIAVVKDNHIIAENSLSIHPEGGAIVDGFNNSIAIHGIQANQVVEVTNGRDSVITETKLNAYGWGAVDLTTAQGSNYFVKYKGDPSGVALSDNSKEGFSIRVDGLDMAAKQLNILAANSKDAPKSVLLITSNNKVFFQSSFSYQSGDQLVRVVPKSILSQGLHQLHIIGSDGATLGYRAFYLSNTGKVTVDLDLSKENVQTRAQVEIPLSLKDESGNRVRGVGAVSVINQSAMDQGGSNTGPHQFGLLDMMESSGDINYFLVSQQPRWIEEDRTFVNASTEFLKSGRAISKTTGEPLSEGAKLLFYFNKSQQLALIKLGAGAEFGFKDVANVHGFDDIFYIAEDFYGFEIEDAYVEWYPERVIGLLDSEVKSNVGDQSKYATFNRNRKLIDQSFSVFEDQKDFSLDEISMADRFDAKYIEADDVFEMANFITFPTMKETITEVVKPLSISRNSKKDIIRMNNLTAATPTSTPVYIIDGVATKDTDYLLSLNTGDLKEIRVYRDRVRLKKLGFLGRNGIIWVSTKAGNAPPPVDPNNHFTAPQKPLVFASRAADDPSPAFESTIYWNPNITIGENGTTLVRFVTSDDVGEYLIKVTGITDGGRYFSTERVIEVGVARHSGEE